MFSKCDRLGFWKSCVTILMVGTACHPDILAQPEPLSDPLPNILLLYADDLGYGDVACYNPSRGLIPTPHIDRLAREGMRWTDAHASSAVCSPSRYTLLTGRYHWRTRLQSGIVGLWGKPVIAPHRRTLASLAKSKNYRTQCIGKWHLGWEWPIPEEHLTFMRHSHTKDVALKAGHVRIWEEIFTQRIGSGPTERGFDHYFGTDVPNWPPYCFIENDHTLGIPTQWLEPLMLERNQASKQGPAIKGWQLKPILPTLTAKCEAFLKDASSHEAPFFLYVSLTAPHTPLAVNDAWKGKSHLGPYADLVMETDAAIGRILQALDDSGEAANTWVIFTSDNGCAPYVDVASMESHGHHPSGPLRGYKSDAWEGGHRVPCIMRWPGVIPPSSISRSLVHQADLMATTAEVLGIPLRADEGVDSYSMLALMKGEGPSARKHAVSCSIRGIPSIRDGKWKLILDAGSGGWSKGDSNHPVQLYNLENDLGEQHNLAPLFPDRVDHMRAMWEEMIDRGRSTPGVEQANDVEVDRHLR